MFMFPTIVFDSVFVRLHRFIREEPSNERFEFVGMCAPGSYNTLSVGGIEECEACETNTFFQRYVHLY